MILLRGEIRLFTEHICGFTSTIYMMKLFVMKELRGNKKINAKVLK